MTTAPATVLRIGTRSSALALTQAGLVRDALATAGVTATLETVITEGDRHAVDTPWGEGAFVSAIEDALLEGLVDVAVHSAKDIPTDEDPRLTIAAYLPRAEAGDVLVLPAGRSIATLDELPRGVRVGTDSPRRTAFLRAARPDLVIHPLHGNVDTRLRRLDDGETDALVLAEAGLARLGRHDRVSLRFEAADLPPAPGQGALAVQVRSDDARGRELVARLDHVETRRAVEAERALLNAAGGGCRTPLGAFGRVGSAGLELLGGYARVDGQVATIARRIGAADDDALVDALLDDLATASAEMASRGPGPRVIVTRSRDQAAATVLALVDRGLVPLSVPTIAVEPAPVEAMAEALLRLSEFDWVVVTSANAVRALRAAAEQSGIALALGRAPGRRSTRWAVVGASTERSLRVAGVRADLRPSRSNAAALAEAMPLEGNERILLPRSDLAETDLPDRLRARGALVEAVEAYRTREAPVTSAPLLSAALLEAPAAVVVTSGSTVRGLLALAGMIGAADAVRRLPAICIGPGTVAAAASHGLRVIGEAPMQGAAGIADAAALALRHQLDQETP